MGNDPSSLKLQCYQPTPAGTPPVPIEGHAAAFIDNCLYIFGGGASENGVQSQSNATYKLTLSLGTEPKLSWTKLECLGEIPSARTGSAATGVGPIMYVIGGLTLEQGWVSDVCAFNTTTLTWSNLRCTGTGPSPRDKFAACAHGTNIYVFGGFGPQAPPSEAMEEEGSSEEEEEEEAATFGWFNELYVLDTQTLTWSRPVTTGTPPTPRAAFAMAVVGNSLVVFGGRDTAARTNDLHVLDLTTLAWRSVAAKGMLPLPRSFHSGTGLGANRFVVFGGLSTDNRHFGDLHVLSLDTDSWYQTQLVGAAPSPRGFHTASLVAPTMLAIFGGSSNWTEEGCTVYHNDVTLIDLTAVSGQLPPLPSSGMPKA